MTEEQRRHRFAMAQHEGWQIFQTGAALLVGRRSMRIFSLLAPCPSPKSLATHPFLFMRWVLARFPLALSLRTWRAAPRVGLSFFFVRGLTRQCAFCLRAAPRFVLTK